MSSSLNSGTLNILCFLDPILLRSECGQKYIHLFSGAGDAFLCYVTGIDCGLSLCVGPLVTKSYANYRCGCS